MKTIVYTLLVSFLLFGCNGCQKESIYDFDNIIDSEKVVDVPINNNIYNFEKYSFINHTVGNIQKRQNIKKFLTDDEIRGLAVEINGRMYWNNVKSSVQYDFFGDGKVDYFGYNPFDCEAQPGVYILIEDINDNPKEPIIFSSKLAANSSATLADVNGDGRPEVLFFSTNNHGYGNCGTNIDWLEPIQKVEIFQNKTIRESNLHQTPIAIHEGTSGDIDNDGDIDVIAWPGPNGAGSNFPNVKFPIKLINDGNGNFTEQPFFNDEFKLTDEGYENWISITNHLMDVNGDGYLDMVGGNFIASIGEFANDVEFISKSKDLSTPKLFIVYGSINGYSYDNVDYLNSVSDDVLELYGITFIDYNKDGNLDIIVESTVSESAFQVTDENTFLVELFRNDGSGFTNVTKETITGYEYRGGKQYTNFYTPISVDIDNDGDFDIVAYDVNYHQLDVNFPKLWYWENINQKFYLKRID